MAETAASDVVWGLELGGSAARLVAVRREGASWRVESFHQIEVPPPPRGAEDNRYAVNFASLAPFVSGPLVVTIPDEEVLYRALTLPAADPSVLGKMVQGQLEVMLPTRADRFTSTWRKGASAGSGERILMAAVKTESLERAASAGRAVTPAVDAVIPSAMALAAAYGALAAPSADPHAIIDLGSRAATIIILQRGEVVEVGTLDRATGEGAKEIDSPAEPSVREWWADLGELYQGLIGKLSAPERPVKAVVAGRAARDPSVIEACASTLRIPASPISESIKLAMPEGVAADEALTAIGAAMAARQPDGAMGFIVRRVEAPERRFVLTRRAKLAALWVLAAVIALFLADWREASWLDASVEHINAAAGPGGIDERLALAAYVNKQAATPLIAYEAMVTALPPPVVPVSWSYSRAGEFRFLGRSPDPAQADAYLKKLSETKLFKSIEIKSLRLDPQRGQWEIEIVGVLQPGIPAPATQPATPPAPASGAMPATSGPAWQPSGEHHGGHQGRRGAH